MKKLILFTLFISIISSCCNCEVDDEDLNDYSKDSGTFVDQRDENVYKWVKINDQIWMAQNLKTQNYLNGNPIHNEIDSALWKNLKTGAYCNYDNNESNIATYGHLYNWYAINDVRKICPSGWHVPSDAEWTNLSDFLGGQNVAGGKLKETGTSHWNSPNTGATDEVNFTAIPGGYRSSLGIFDNIGEYGFWWSATDVSANYAWGRNMSSGSSLIYRGYEDQGYAKVDGFSVRCVKD